MYWWHVSKLAAHLREGRVDEKERFKYYLATFIAWNLLAQLFFYSGGPYSIEGLISTAVNVTAAIIGIVLCYRVNRSGDNADFIGRIICLGWPVGISLMVIFSALFLVTSVVPALPSAALGISSFLSAVSDEVWRFWTTVSGIAFVGVYYYTIHLHLAAVAQTKGAEDALETKTPHWSAGEVVLAVLGGVGLAIVLIHGGDLAHSLVGQGPLADTLTFLVVGIWLLSIGSILAWLGGRSAKRT